MEPLLPFNLFNVMFLHERAFSPGQTVNGQCSLQLLHPNAVAGVIIFRPTVEVEIDTISVTFQGIATLRDHRTVLQAITACLHACLIGRSSCITRPLHTYDTNQCRSDKCV